MSLSNKGVTTAPDSAKVIDTNYSSSSKPDVKLFSVDDVKAILKNYGPRFVGRWGPNVTVSDDSSASKFKMVPNAAYRTVSNSTEYVTVGTDHLKVVKPGYYKVVANVNTYSNADCVRRLYIHKSTNEQQNTVQHTIAGYFNLSLETTNWFEVGKEIIVQAAIEAGSSRNQFERYSSFVEVTYMGSET